MKDTFQTQHQNILIHFVSKRYILLYCHERLGLALFDPPFYILLCLLKSGCQFLATLFRHISKIKNCCLMYRLLLIKGHRNQKILTFTNP